MIPENLQIQEEKLRTCLDYAKEATERLWTHPLLQHYTNHGPDHSQRIIDIIGRLLENDSKILNDYERFILIASAYLHDIGMQSPIHAGLIKKTDYTWAEKK